MSEDDKLKLRGQLRKAATELGILASCCRGMDDKIIEAKMKEFGLKYVRLFGLVVEDNRKGV